MITRNSPWAGPDLARWPRRIGTSRCLFWDMVFQFGICATPVQNAPQHISVKPTPERDMANGNKAVLAILVAVVIIVAAFGLYVAAFMSANTGKVTIMVKDLPDNWTHVNVTFSKVEIHQAEANNSGWLNLTVTRQTIDLASLVNVSQLLASGSVGPGKYTQIRIIVESATGTMSDGTIVNFTVPSGELKTTHPFNVTAGQTTTMTVDIDLEHSIGHNANGWFFKPVLGSVESS